MFVQMATTFSNMTSPPRHHGDGIRAGAIALSDECASMVSIDDLVQRLVLKYDPDRVILFGSHARGDAHARSDVDLIIIKPTAERFLDRLEHALEAMDPDRAVDVLVYTPDEFEQMKASETPFIIHAMKGAKELYVRPRP